MPMEGISPLLIVLGAALFLNEQMNWRAWTGVILTCVILVYPLSSTATYSLLVLETIMLVFFGLSWFVKGRKILSGG